MIKNHDRHIPFSSFFKSPQKFLNASAADLLINTSPELLQVLLQRLQAANKKCALRSTELPKPHLFM
jgi:hypothetical protein